MTSGWNSYWLDELLSTQVYGLWNDSLSKAIAHLADASVHPPLYQTILYLWMKAFGDTEVATRSLSNLYISGATILLFFLVKRFWGRPVGTFVAVAFTVMNLPTYYGMETRSYAQTIFFATLSSLLFLEWASKLIREESGGILRSGVAVGLLAANTALMLTHYYNAFFLAAQAVVAAGFVLWRYRPRRWLAKLSAASLLYLLPVGLFGIAWGRVFFNTFERSASQYEVTDPEELTGSVDLLKTSVVYPNLNPGTVFKVIGAVAIGAVIVFSAVRLLGRGRRDSELTSRSWSVLYLAAWLGGPLVIANAAFLMAGVARYSTRYFLYCVPALAALLMITARQWGVWMGMLFRRSWVTTGAWVLASLLVIAALLPGFYDAANRPKHDWRGIAAQVIEVVRANPEYDYLIFETGTRRESMLDYYLERFSDRIRVTGTIPRFEEGTGRYRFLEQHEDRIARADFFIVTFAHTRVRDYPELLEALSSKYPVHHRQLSRTGRGFIIFDARG